MTEKELTEAIAKTKADYIAAVETKPAKECQAISAKLVALQKQLGEQLASGAKPAPDGSKPVAMLKTPAYYDAKKGVDVPPVYEVGSLSTPHRSRGTTPEQAVEKWNKDQWYQGDAKAIAEWDAEHKAKQEAEKKSK